LLTQAGSSETPFGFTGYQKDDETGLYYANARYYDSETGRFLREDPQDGNTSEPPSLHRYLYANANPNFYTDPTGEAAYGFDGTNVDRATGVNSNVSRLLDVFDTPNRFYQPGIGTNEATSFGNGLGSITGYGGDKRLDQMYQNLIKTYNGVGRDGSQIEADRDIDLIGFSRGAALARAFANIINERGIPDLSSARTVTVSLMGQSKQYTVYDHYFKPEIRSMSLFDTVGSFGLAGNQDEGNKDLSIPPNVQNVFHAISRDETRSGFPLSSVIDPDNPNDPRIRERSFTGVHTDIGCCYADDESLSYDPLYWIWNELDALNVPIDSLPPEYMPIAPHDAVSAKRLWIPYADTFVNVPQQGGRTVHDSRFIKSNFATESPREIFYYNNPSTNDPTSKKKAFAPKNSIEHERLLQEIYKKNHEVITENPNAPQ
jgi:RHS repeat-associated protein